MILAVPALFFTGAFAWTLGEYLLHRFAMHEMHGRGKLSSEHLQHHVQAQWSFDPILLLAWLGVVLVAVFGWGTLGWLVSGPVAGLSLASGWTLGYGFYEFQHAMSHIRGPRGPYTRWIRRSHFFHHFGHPMSNHGVTLPLWDKVFGTYGDPGVLRVPRRMAMPWLLDEDGNIKAEYASDYVLVGPADADARLAALDHARAFASEAPVPA